MTDFENGDTISLLYTGTVQEHSNTTVTFTDFRVFGLGGTEVTVLAKRPAGVGDVVQTVEELQELPDRAVLIDADSNPYIVSDGWLATSPDVDRVIAKQGETPYVIVYLP